MSFSWAGHQENVENWIRKLQEIAHPKKIVLKKYGYKNDDIINSTQLVHTP